MTVDHDHGDRRDAERDPLEQGSATIWVIALIALIVGTVLAGVARSDAVLARHHAEQAADLAALAAAEQIGRGGDICAAASRIATANGATLMTCRPSIDATGRSGTVRISLLQKVKLPILGIAEVAAHARAGRLTPETGDAA
jgi:secretion/DNA translocation related TadE-like protein